jgi:catechol 2,3-dioxygenase-like lactoylglutathione lyase family enzyme
MTTSLSTGITGLSHISIQVRDTGRALGFYRDFLGLHVTVDLEVETQRTIGGQPTQVTRRVTFLRWEDYAGAPYIVLGQLVSHAPISRALDLGEVGVDHFALRVDQLDPFLARARETGVEIVKDVAVHPAQSYGHVGAGQARVAMFRDPDGTLVQLDEWI